MSFADNLRAAMRKAKVSQSELARRLGIRSQAVNQWLQPEGTAPRGARLREVAAAVGVELSELLAEPLTPPVALSRDQARAELLATYDTLDERDRNVLLRIAQSMRRDVPLAGPLGGDLVKRQDELAEDEAALIDIWRALDDYQRTEFQRRLRRPRAERARA
jgi:transcriptional regulator with XRE-family HTH domain